MFIEYERDSHDVVWFFCKQTYCICVSVGIMSNALLNAASILDTSADPNSVNKEFLSRGWKESIKLIKSPPLQTAGREVNNVEGIFHLIVSIGGSCARAWFGTVGNLAVDLLLGMLFFEECIHGIFQTERELVVPWHSKPMAITTTMTVIF